MSNFQIAVIGEYNENYLPKAKTNEVLERFQEKYDFDFQWISTQELVKNHEAILEKYSGIWLGSGSYKSPEGAANAVYFARKNNIPFLGTCSGFGISVLEFAKTELGISDIDFAFKSETNSQVNSFLEPLSYCGLEHYEITIKTKANTKAHEIYNNSNYFIEISHCSYGINPDKIAVFEANGMIAGAFTDDGEVKIFEYSKNDFYLITLFYPQLNSSSNNPHPVLEAFIEKSMQQYRNKIKALISEFI